MGAALFSLRLFLRSILELWCVRSPPAEIERTTCRQRWILFVSANVCVTQCSFCEFYTLHWSHDLCSSVRSMKTSAALRPEIRNPIVVSLNIATAVLVTIHFRHCARLFLSRCMNAHLSPNLHPDFVCIFDTVPITARWSGAITSQVLPARRSRGFPRRTAASENPSSRNCFLIFFNQRFRGRSGHWCRFYTLILILSETTSVSFQTLSFRLPLPEFSQSSLNATSTPAILNHSSCFNSHISGVKIS